MVNSNSSSILPPPRILTWGKILFLAFLFVSAFAQAEPVIYTDTNFPTTDITAVDGVEFQISIEKSYGNIISGTGAVSKTEIGTLELTAANTYTGATTVSGGTLKLSGSGKLASSTINIGSGATMLYYDTVPHNTSDLTINLAQGGKVEFDMTATGRSVDTSLSSGINLTFTGDGTWIKSGTGDLHCESANNSPVTFALSSKAKMVIENGSFTNGGWQNQNWSSNYAELEIKANGKLDLWDGNKMQVGGLTGEKGAQMLAGYTGPRGITIGAGTTSDQTFAYNGVMDFAYAATVTKTGDSTQILNGDIRNATIQANGGTLVFADVLDHNPMSRFAAETAPLKIGVEKDVEISGELSDNVKAEAGIVKSGEGDLHFTNFHALPSPAVVSNGLMYVKVNLDFSGKIEVVNEDATLALYAGGKELSVEVTNEDQSKTRTGATVHGAGTLRLDTEAGKDWGWRLTNADFSDFTGTLEVTAINENNSGTAHGITGRWDGWDNHLENTTLKISGAPAEDRIVFFEERNSLKLGAIQLLDAHAQFKITSDNDPLTFGDKANSESILNGQFVANKVLLVKNGDTPLTLGPGFSVVDGSSLSVNAGTLIANQDVFGDLNYTLTIASGVKLAGSGVFGAVDLSVNDVVAPDITAETDKTTEFTLLTATSITGKSATMSTLLAEVNAGDAHGKWKLVKVANGDGTVTLKCVYSKNAFVIILR